MDNWKALFVLGLIFLLFSFSCKNAEVQQESGPQLDFYHSVHGQGHGPPIIVIHGGPGLGSTYMESHLMGLSRDHELIFYDQVNSGRSQMTQDPARVSLASFLADIDNLRKHYGHQKVSLLAHSWGGLLAMKYATKYPERVDKLILVNSISADSKVNGQVNTRVANLFSADDLEARTIVMRSEAFRTGKSEAYEELMNIGFAYQFSDRNLIRSLQLGLPDDFESKSRLLTGLYEDLTDYNFTEEIKTIACPTFLLYGIDDPGTPLNISALSAAIPNAEMKVIDYAGHFPFIEQPLVTMDAIRSFIKS